ncbi:MAG: hypothetical protein NZ585_00095 [Chloracidobacterium sp.]|nr:hypothetical protein [Chloracidobacterium sp.]MDW8216594.1 hypothetical protein [Acidobacteriota bacterium]
MSYEHLKASWRAEVEAIVRAELSKLEAEIARMHHQVEQAFTQLLSQSAARLAAVSHDSAIADFTDRALTHLAALTTAPPTPTEVARPLPEAAPTAPTVDLQTLYHYLVELQSQPTQAEVLNLLVTRALEYAPRAALFVVKTGGMVAWAERGFEASGVSLRGMTLSLQAQTTLRAAIDRQIAVLDSPYAYAENQLLLDRLGSVPAAIGSIPLLVRGKVAALLYIDTGDQPVTRIALPPLQILVNTAGLTVELINARNRLVTTAAPAVDRTTQAAPAVSPETPPAAVEAPSRSEAVHATPSVAPTDEVPVATAVAPVVQPTEEAPPAAEVVTPETDRLKTQLIDGAYPSPEPEATAAKDSRAVAESPPEPTFEPQPLPPVVPPGPTIQEPEPTTSVGLTATPTAYSAPSPTPTFEVVTPPASAPPNVAEPAPAETASPSNGFTIQPLTPSQGGPAVTPRPEAAAMPPGPPKPTTEEEAKAHNDARRFARLLVSEIKLYNEAKVAEGRLNHDLYDRLKEDIDRSRQMYDKRVSPIVAAKFDYFYDELVSLLAEGDKSRLGADCPGPVLLQPE